MKIEQHKKRSSSTERRSGSPVKKKKGKLKLAVKIHFYRQLSSLLEAGMDLHSCLSLIQTSDPKGKLFFLPPLIQKIEGGQGLAESLKQTGNFSTFEIESLHAAEQSGLMVQVLNNLLEYFEFRSKISKTIVGALSYPALLLTVSVAVIFFMLRFVVPLFEDIYRQMNRELPAITQYLISASNFFQVYSLWIFLLICVAVFGVLQLLKNEDFKARFEAVLYKSPILGSFYINILKSKLTSLIHFLIQAKVPLNLIVSYCAQSSTSVLLYREMTDVQHQIERGNSLTEALNQSRFFNISDKSLIRLGEETKNLELSFGQISKQLQERLEFEANMLNKVLEPILISFVAIFIALVLVSLYLPLFSVSL
ncbi:MAG: hypothetical protein CL843_01080 [Crocinitomicaceae bacterium]|nr:hypothetical protein [Crocinitomicaceae bacterium]|tara:strand:+ start:1483 stop:2580 length:1098 start_codon:yes stop_codon:yes gene_type:complete